MTETEIIARFFAPLACPDGADSLKDDVAELIAPGHKRLIVTTDALVENIHFFSNDPLSGVGRKLVAVNVSDILAKGAVPHAASLTLIWPRSRPAEDVADFAHGLGAALQEHQCPLLGGDTVVSDGPLCLSLTMHGACLNPDGPIRRTGAKTGDEVWISGSIGDAHLGLLSAKGLLPDMSEADRARLEACYRVPALPPASIAEVIADTAHATIDISDGLLADAGRLASVSKISLQIEAESIPFSEEARLWMGDDREKFMALVTGGDDYQALFTAPSAATPELMRACHQTRLKLTRIGRCAASPEQDFRANIRLKGQTLNIEQTGFDHFYPPS